MIRVCIKCKNKFYNKSTRKYCDECLSSEIRICACGCGQKFKTYKTSVKQYICGHQRKNKKCSKKTKKQMSITRMARLKKLGYLNSKKTRKKLSKAAYKQFENGMPIETREKISKTEMGRKRPDLKWKEGPNRGKKFSIKTRKNMSKAATKRFMNKENPHWSRGKTGKFYSKKNKKELWYLSKLELAAYKILEQLNVVVKYETNPLRIPYKYLKEYHNYIPDILVYYKNGTKQLVEVKMEIDLKHKITKIKANAAIKYCKENNIEYKFWTEKELGLQ